MNTPRFVHVARGRRHDPKVTRAFPATGEPQNQSFFPIEPIHPLAVNPPVTSSQDHVQQEIPEAGTGVDQLAKPSPEDEVISSVVSVIPRARLKRSSPHARPTEMVFSPSTSHTRARLRVGIRAFLFASTSGRTLNYLAIGLQLG